MFDWNDIRHFLAVAETGSTLAAGRALRVSQTTVARRVAAIEAAFGLVLFERRQAGYALTPAGERLLGHARAVEAAARGLDDAAAAQKRETGGVVRLTVSHIYATTILPPLLRDLHDAHPDIHIDLETTDEKRDLAAGGADVALRTTDRPAGGGLVARRLIDDQWAIYCSRAYAAEHGRPRRRAELRGHPFVGGGGDGVWQIYQHWLRENDLESAVAIHHNSALGLLAAVRAGMGLAVLPCIVADNDPDLVLCLPPAAGETRGIWLLTHERLRHIPRIRTVLDFLGRRLPRLVIEETRRIE
ncbi:LysR family transcriptional regulator [Sphingomonas gilva]|uniref:LysR family transcriptional regulator n=1 Tax=Sphingomonas gilva TaxID=2305907 RepID=A0A396RR95_9SPHN|nr:LysR family transcriptional regulator [Sphingomonas gilva]RHW16813.1 LysR family transcriptional regulator [Sphingomonas gilva]